MRDMRNYTRLFFIVDAYQNQTQKQTDKEQYYQNQSTLRHVFAAEMAICQAAAARKVETSQDLQMLSSVTLDCQVTKIIMNSGSQL